MLSFINTRFTIIFATVLFLVINIPVWWRTTGAIQTALPHEAIANQTNISNPLNYQLPVYLCVHFIGSKQFIEHHQGKQIAQVNTLRDAKALIPIQIIAQRHSVLSSGERTELLKKANSENEFDDLLIGITSALYEEQTGQFTLFIVDEVSTGILKKNELFFGKHRHAWLCTDELFDTQQLTSYIQTVHNVITFNYRSNEELQIKSSSNQYRLTFTLVNQDPASKNVIWDFKQMEQRYLKPFLNKISPTLLTNVSVDSQIINYGQLPSKPSFNSEKKIYELRASEMQLLLNENDWKLDSYAYTDPTVHFLLFVPEEQNTPLRIIPYDNNKKEIYSITEDAYVIPRWGGVVILNSENINSSKLTENQEALVMQSFVEQFRMLLSLPSFVKELQYGGLQIIFVPDQQSGISDWELDQLIRLRILQNMATAKHSLESLSQVVAKMSNVLVMQEVSQLTEESLAQLQIATHILRDGRRLIIDYDTLLNAAKLAMEKSEKAFFHPSMISLLHFPDSQKMAIYLPLLLPIIVTVLSAAVRELKYIIQKPRTA
jgi:phosphatidylinositol glycan class S